MSRVKKVLGEVRRLPRAEQKKLLAALERELSSERRAPRKQSSRTASVKRKAAGSKPLYKSLLEAAGTVHSDFSDLSSDKYKHVAAAAMDERT